MPNLQRHTAHNTIQFLEPPFLVLCAVCRWPAPVLHYAEIIQQQWGGVFLGSAAALVQRRHIPPDPPTNDNRKQTKRWFGLKNKNVFVRRRPRARIKRFGLPVWPERDATWGPNVAALHCGRGGGGRFILFQTPVPTALLPGISG